MEAIGDEKCIYNQAVHGLTNRDISHFNMDSKGAGMKYEYKMVQIPPSISIKAKDQVGNEAADYLESLANEAASSGWEFWRVDTIGVMTSPGCLGSLFGRKAEYLEYYVVSFRKQLP
jgi:hypothetical protein